MARPVPMGDLVRRSLRRVDLEHNSPFTPPEVKALISEQYGQLYSHVIQSNLRYFEANQAIVATGALSYPLPADHDCSIGIDRIIDASTGQIAQLDELMVQERDRLSGMIGDACYYSVVGQSIVFFPRPSTGTYTHIYVPQSPDISAFADATTVDMVTADGETFLIYGVAVKMAPKSEIDASMLITERDAAERRFIIDVGKRALTNPRRRVVRPTPLEWEDY